MTQRVVRARLKPIEVKPQAIERCPFCGGTAKLNVLKNKNGSFYYVRCIGCACEGPWEWSRLLAVNSWNRRV